MREILFRGKDPDTGRWHVGIYWKYDDVTYCFKEDYDRHPENTHHVIIFTEPGDWGLPNKHKQADIDPRTLGQYTGLTDKNGKKVFEGDIVRGIIVSRWVMREIKCEVVYKRDSFLCREHNGNLHKLMFAKNIEVIGNIHDNPELLEETGQ